MQNKSKFHLSVVLPHGLLQDLISPCANRRFKIAFQLIRTHLRRISVCMVVYIGTAAPCNKIYLRFFNFFLDVHSSTCFFLVFLRSVTKTAGSYRQVTRQTKYPWFAIVELSSQTKKFRVCSKLSDTSFILLSSNICFLPAHKGLLIFSYNDL